jgi:hypothetical protein
LLNIWEILGILILAGPLLVTLIALTYVYVRTGIEELVGRTKEPAFEMEMDLSKYIMTNRELKKYVDELAHQRTFKGRIPVFVQWFARMTIAPFTLITLESFRLEYFILQHGLPYFPHALIITMLSLSIVMVSIYYGFFVEYQ